MTLANFLLAQLVSATDSYGLHWRWIFQSDQFHFRVTRLWYTKKPDREWRVLASNAGPSDGDGLNVDTAPPPR